MQFEFATATRIVFGSGSAAGLADLVRGFGKRALVVTGSNAGRAQNALSILDKAGIHCTYFPAPGEPSLETVRRGVVPALACDFVIGFGGGSALDAAKAIAAVTPNSGEPLDYLEVIGRGRPLEKTPLPFVAIPTTAGTGAEVTRNAVLGSPEDQVKASLRSPSMLAKLAVIDPDLTVDLPARITADTGLDTLTQLIEPFVSNRTNAFTDLFCLEGMRRVKCALRSAFLDGQNRVARADMSFASLLSGLALANAGLGVVHGFAAPLGGMLNAPHGALCAALLPHGMAVNIRALRRSHTGGEALNRYRQLAQLLTADPQAEAESSIPFIASLCRDLGVRPLSAYGLDASQMSLLVERAAAASSMKANPVKLSVADLTEIAERSL